MTILTVSSVSLSYGTDEILNDISFSVNEGERLGVIGANGAGKTTLFHIITGKIRPDRGSVAFARGAQVRLLSQKPEDDFGDKTVLDWALGSFSHLHEAELRLTELAERLSEGRSADAERYAALEEDFRRAGGYEYKAKTRTMLERFGFSAEDFGKPAALLSGGQKTRLALLSVLVSDTDVSCSMNRPTISISKRPNGLKALSARRKRPFLSFHTTVISSTASPPKRWSWSIRAQRYSAVRTACSSKKNRSSAPHR